jgi:hypothetical protein
MGISEAVVAPTRARYILTRGMNGKKAANNLKLDRTR